MPPADSTVVVFFPTREALMELQNEEKTLEEFCFNLLTPFRVQSFCVNPQFQAVEVLCAMLVHQNDIDHINDKISRGEVAFPESLAHVLPYCVFYLRVVFNVGVLTGTLRGRGVDHLISFLPEDGTKKSRDTRIQLIKGMDSLSGLKLSSKSPLVVGKSALGDGLPKFALGSAPAVATATTRIGSGPGIPGITTSMGVDIMMDSMVDPAPGSGSSDELLTKQLVILQQQQLQLQEQMRQVQALKHLKEMKHVQQMQAALAKQQAQLLAAAGLGGAAASAAIAGAGLTGAAGLAASSAAAAAAGAGGGGVSRPGLFGSLRPGGSAAGIPHLPIISSASAGAAGVTKGGPAVGAGPAGIGEWEAHEHLLGRSAGKERMQQRMDDAKSVGHSESGSESASTDSSSDSSDSDSSDSERSSRRDGKTKRASSEIQGAAVTGGVAKMFLPGGDPSPAGSQLAGAGALYSSVFASPYGTGVSSGEDNKRGFVLDGSPPPKSEKDGRKKKSSKKKGKRKKKSRYDDSESDDSSSDSDSDSDSDDSSVKHAKKGKSKKKSKSKSPPKKYQLMGVDEQRLRKDVEMILAGNIDDFIAEKYGAGPKSSMPDGDPLGMVEAPLFYMEDLTGGMGMDVMAMGVDPSGMTVGVHGSGPVAAVAAAAGVDMPEMKASWEEPTPDGGFGGAGGQLYEMFEDGAKQRGSVTMAHPPAVGQAGPSAVPATGPSFQSHSEPITASKYGGGIPAAGSSAVGPEIPAVDPMQDDMDLFTPQQSTEMTRRQYRQNRLKSSQDKIRAVIYSNMTTPIGRKAGAGQDQGVGVTPGGPGAGGFPMVITGGVPQSSAQGTSTMASGVPARTSVMRGFGATVTAAPAVTAAIAAVDAAAGVSGGAGLPPQTTRIRHSAESQDDADAFSDQPLDEEDDPRYTGYGGVTRMTTIEHERGGAGQTAHRNTAVGRPDDVELMEFDDTGGESDHSSNGAMMGIPMMAEDEVVLDIDPMADVKDPENPFEAAQRFDDDARGLAVLRSDEVDDDDEEEADLPIPAASGAIGLGKDLEPDLPDYGRPPAEVEMDEEEELDRRGMRDQRDAEAEHARRLAEMPLGDEDADPLPLHEQAMVDAGVASKHHKRESTRLLMSSLVPTREHGFDEEREEEVEKHITWGLICIEVLDWFKILSNTPRMNENTLSELVMAMLDDVSPLEETHAQEFGNGLFLLTTPVEVIFRGTVLEDMKRMPPEQRDLVSVDAKDACLRDLAGDLLEELSNIEESLEFCAGCALQDLAETDSDWVTAAEQDLEETKTYRRLEAHRNGETEDVDVISKFPDLEKRLMRQLKMYRKRPQSTSQRGMMEDEEDLAGGRTDGSRLDPRILSLDGVSRVKSGDTEELRVVEDVAKDLKEIDDMGLQDEHGDTALIIACGCDRDEESNIVIDPLSGEDDERMSKQANQTGGDGSRRTDSDDTGETLTLINVLLDHGGSVDVNHQNNEGMTALMFATLTKNIAVVHFLLDRGAMTDIAAHTFENKTALHFACNIGRYSIAELLINFGANVDCQTSVGETPLIMASSRGDLSMVDLLLKSNCDVNAAAQDGFTALMVAAQKGFNDLVEMLLDFGADSTLENVSQENAYVLAKRQGHSDICGLLLQ